MIDFQKQLLSDLHERFKSGKRGMTISLDVPNPRKKQSIFNQVKYLEEKGLVHITAQAIGFIELRLASDGVDYVENGFSDNVGAPAIQGENSIYVNGSNNIISDNYNSVKTEIHNSELPDEAKMMGSQLVISCSVI